jgi:hypothetical protein
MAFRIVNGKLVQVNDPVLPLPTPGGMVAPTTAPGQRSTGPMVNRKVEGPNLTNIYTPSGPRQTNVYTPSGPRQTTNIYTPAPPRQENVYRVEQRPGQKIEASTPSHLVDYGFEIKPTKDKTYGPNTGRVQAVIGAVGSLSPEAAKLAGAARGTTSSAASSAARGAARDAASTAARDAARYAAMDAARRAAMWAAADATRGAAADATLSEVSSDKITPEDYRILTNPLNVGLTYDRKVKELAEDPEKLGAFRRATGSGGITTPEQVSQLGSQSRSTLDYFVGMPSNLTFEQRLKRAQGLSRAQASKVRGTADRMENRAKAMGDKK